MDFTLYNTMTRKKEKLQPVSGNQIGIYSCGPTVHNYAHIGNLRKYIMDDILVKSLRFAGFSVKHVMNITDIGHLQSDADDGEDKMLLSALREKEDAMALARRYEDSFFSDCRRLNITRPDIVCRATEHIGDMIALIQHLSDLGYTYCAGGNVYFDVSKFERYPLFARLNMKQLQPGSRTDIDFNKRNPFDFVLWFTSSKYENHILLWDSPWGKGYPGWHIECSAMALKYLGEYLDIHTGGVDHIPVHHTNEIAQSEAAIGHKWVNCWVHSEFLITEGEKMSKSSGDFLTLTKVCEDGFSPLDYRFFCLQSRYRQQLNYRTSSMLNARDTLKSLYEKVTAISAVDEASSNNSFGTRSREYETAFLAQISDDLNTPNALTVLYDVIKDAALSSGEKLRLIQTFDSILSLDLLKQKSVTSAAALPNEIIVELIAKRNQARADKDYAEADRIREELAAQNVISNDTPQGTKWSIKTE